MAEGFSPQTLGNGSPSPIWTETAKFPVKFISSFTKFDALVKKDLIECWEIADEHKNGFLTLKDSSSPWASCH